MGGEDVEQGRGKATDTDREYGVKSKNQTKATPSAFQPAFYYIHLSNDPTGDLKNLFIFFLNILP